jgi:hypothetical protein
VTSIEHVTFDDITGTGHLYGFDMLLKHWTCLFYKDDFVSDFALPTELLSSGPLSILTKSYGTINNDDIYHKRFYTSVHRELLVSAYLETQIHRSRVLHSSHEYSFWLTSFVRFLANSSLNDKSLKLKSILDHLSEHVHSTSNHMPYTNMILKSQDDYRNLLDQCLTILRHDDDASILIQHYQ